MKKFIPLTILAFFVLLISIAIYNLNKKQSDNATNSSVNILEDSEEPSSEAITDFDKVDVDLPDFQLPNLFDSERPITKKDFIGKYTILNFFASWCSTCIMEHDMLLRLQQEGVADLYGVAWRDINENTIKFLKEKGNPFSLVGVDSKADFGKILDIEAVPETWLINPDGKIVLRLKGNLQDFSIEDIRRYIKAN